MKTGKIGAIFLMSILALAGIGMSYAAWTDTITISGTVATGDVDLVVVSYSGQWVWKIWEGDGVYPDEIFITDDPKWLPTDEDGDFIDEFWPEPIASAWAGPAATDDAVTVTFENLFPLDVYLYADVLLHYEGSIPVKVNEIFLALDDDLMGLVTDIQIYRSDETGTLIGEPVEFGEQLHFCNYIKVIIGVLVPQRDETMNLDGTITGKINVIQWNEFP